MKIDVKTVFRHLKRDGLVSKLDMVQNVLDRVSVVSSLLLCHKEERFLDKTVTGDKKKL